MRLLLASILVALLVSMLFAEHALAKPRPVEGGAMDREAEALYKSGLASYAEHDYESAIEDLEAAFELQPHRNILFAWAQALRQDGRCAQATGLFHRFVASGPGPEQIEAAKALLVDCADVLRREKERQRKDAKDEKRATEKRRATDDKSRDPAEEEKSPQSMQAPSAWYDDTLGLGLSSAGLLGLALGGGFALSSRSAAGRAREARSYLEFEDLVATSDRHQTISVVASTAGGALLLIGLVRLATRDSGEKRTELSLWSTHDASGLAFGGRFQ